MRQLLITDIPHFVLCIQDRDEQIVVLTRLINRLLKKHSVYCNNGNAVGIIELGRNLFISGYVKPTNRVEELAIHLLRGFNNRANIHSTESFLLDYVRESKPELSFYKRSQIND